jgi:hypothetical protein
MSFKAQEIRHFYCSNTPWPFKATMICTRITKSSYCLWISLPARYNHDCYLGRCHRSYYRDVCYGQIPTCHVILAFDHSVQNSKSLLQLLVSFGGMRFFYLKYYRELQFLKDKKKAFYL